MQKYGRWQGQTLFRHFGSERAIPVSDTHFVVHESATGRILGSATITRDISDIKRARDEREAAIRELEEVNRKLHRAVRARDEVLGIVAHDLRNPLSSIVFEAAFLKRQCAGVGGCGPESALAIHRSATHMNRLIQDLLDVTRLEAGGIGLERHRVPTRQVVAESMDAHSAIAATTSVELRLEAAGDVPDVWADRDRLLQVLENLIGNALKFTGRGGSVTVGAVPRDGEVLFSVSDTGVGISAEDAPHIFDRFMQVRKDERGGAGLGLAIVKGIVEAHGGRVWVVSTLGHGATFFFTIPTMPHEPTRHESAKGAAIPGEVGGPRGQEKARVVSITHHGRPGRPRPSSGT
jgi:signal transduction histidine kinase